MLNVTALGALADNYIWAIAAGNDARVAIVDPGEAAPVRTFLSRNNLQLGAILITHHHPDHTGGVEALLRETPVPVYGPAEATRTTTITDQIGEADRVDLDWLGLQLETIAVPGHTSGHIALHGQGLLFCGDTLFRGGCGRLFEGDATQMRASLNKLRALPAETRVYCGHEYTQKNLRFAAEVEPDNKAVRNALDAADRDREAGQPTLPSTIGAEREINPFMRWDAPAVVAAAEQYQGRAPADADEVLAIVRQWKDAS